MGYIQISGLLEMASFTAETFFSIDSELIGIQFEQSSERLKLPIVMKE